MEGNPYQDLFLDVSWAGSLQECPWLNDDVVMAV